MTDSSSERFRDVLVYIDSHLDADLSVGALAAVARYSAFHFHRRFAALTGMAVHRYVQLARFRRAAWQAAFRPGVSVTAMAFDAGYESVEAFSRAFRQRLGLSPSAFREAPDWTVWATAWQDLDHVRRFHMSESAPASDVRLVSFPETRVALLAHVGPPAALGETLRRFIAWRRSQGLAPAKAATWNIVYDDPETAPPEAYRLDLCVSCDAVPANSDGIVAGHIPGGRCAVLRHVGAGSTLGESARYLYGDWLSSSGEVLRDAPLFFRRVAFFPDVPEHEAITDIYLPLA